MQGARPAVFYTRTVRCTGCGTPHTASFGSPWLRPDRGFDRLCLRVHARSSARYEDCAGMSTGCVRRTGCAIGMWRGWRGWRLCAQ
eukprot:scaffold131944_cov39-Tisochrysis_lutea.AAC.1